MRYVLCLLFACFLLAALFSPARATASEQGASVPANGMAYREEAERIARDETANAVNAFAIDVYQQLAGGGGNIFFSPFSISSALAMVYAGARGETAEEMANVLHFAELGQAVHLAMNDLQWRFNSIPEESGSLNIANRLWLDARENLTSDFKELINEFYGAGVEVSDFLNNYEAERVKINDWVAHETRDRIRDLLQEGNLTPDTVLVLVNAIYFNAAWQVPFERALTREEPFRTGIGEQHDVPMMRRTVHFMYGENEYAQLIKVPYDMPGFSMLILLPRENEAFTQMEELENQLTHEALASWRLDMGFSQVALRMPRFRDEQRYALGDVLQRLGMNLAFTANADFSGMVKEPRDGPPVHMDFVVHKAFIELDEERTEAAAATGIGISATSARIDPEPIIEFNADRPFIYCIIDDETGLILFMGRMERP